MGRMRGMDNADRDDEWGGWGRMDGEDEGEGWGGLMMSPRHKA